MTTMAYNNVSNALRPKKFDSWQFWGELFLINNSLLKRWGNFNFSYRKWRGSRGWIDTKIHYILWICAWGTCKLNIAYLFYFAERATDVFVHPFRLHHNRQPLCPHRHLAFQKPEVKDEFFHHATGDCWWVSAISKTQLEVTSNTRSHLPCYYFNYF